MRVQAVIVNYRTPELALQAARGLLPQVREIPGSGITIVENDSRDHSLELLTRAVASEGLGEHVKVIASDHNGGFGYGVNVGVRAGLASATPPDLFYILNPDATPLPGTLRAILAFLTEHPQAGIVGTHVLKMDDTTEVAALRFPTLASEVADGLQLGIVSRWLDRFIVARPHPGHDCRVDWVSGASMAVSRRTFEAVGLFDESYFLYFEETDFCKRAAKAGFECWYIQEGAVRHIGGAATGMHHGRRVPPFWFASRRRYFRKHHGPGYLLLCDVAWALGHLAFGVRRRIQGKPNSVPPHFFRDFLRYNFLPVAEGRPTGTDPDAQG
jgi:N-acetylglucosaminyl-diphospho-decaprenol L-rhamnosyltransferase